MTGPTHTLTSRIVTAIETTWRSIAAQQPDLPARVAVTLGSGTQHARAGEWTKGHYAAGRWHDNTSTEAPAVHDLFIAGELLALGPADVLATVLHEAAHCLAHERGITDTSRNGRYHNKRYATLAREVGLTVETVGTIGWSATTLTDSASNRYADQVADLTAAIAAHRSAEAQAARGGRTSNNNGLTLTCGCRKIRLSHAAADLGTITCNACGNDFDPAD